MYSGVALLTAPGVSVSPGATALHRIPRDREKWRRMIEQWDNDIAEDVAGSESDVSSK